MKDIFLLDADETLLDFCKAEHEALRRVFEEYGIPFDGERAARYHEINDGLWKKLERGERTRERIIVERFELFFAEYGVKADANAVSERFFHLIAEGAFLLDGAETFLQKISTRGRVFIVTNGAKYTQTKRLKQSGIADYMQAAFISEEIGVYKPSEKYAQYVEEHIPDYERSRAVWVGDSLSSDCACAKSKDIDFILFCPKGVPCGYGGAYATDYDQLFIMLTEA